MLIVSKTNFAPRILLVSELNSAPRILLVSELNFALRPILVSELNSAPRLLIEANLTFQYTDTAIRYFQRSALPNAMFTGRATCLGRR
jgi:hypothetical protein